MVHFVTKPDMVHMVQKQKQFELKQKQKQTNMGPLIAVTVFDATWSLFL